MPKGKETEPTGTNRDGMNFYLLHPNALRFSGTAETRGHRRWYGGMLSWNNGTFEVEFDRNSFPDEQPVIPARVLEDILHKEEEIESEGIPLTCLIYDGYTMAQTGRLMAETAQSIGKPVRTEFKGVLLTAGPKDTAQTVEKHYDRGLRKTKKGKKGKKD